MKMRIPKTIKVGNITYNIKREDHDGYHGIHYYNDNDNDILLNTKLTGDKLRDVFFHELTHAILHQIGADEENENEVFVQALANSLNNIFELKTN